jgi:Ice-binding-like/Putative Tad-like Flp pilus-assembly/Putative Ice-binding-like adhesive domain
MKKRRQTFIKNQSGAMTVMVALLMTVLLSAAALSFDYGYMSMVQAELQKAAEAGALAGASVLGSTTNPDWATAQAKAAEFVQQNKAAGQPLTDSQVDYGYWSLTDRTLPLKPVGSTLTPTDVAAIQVEVAKKDGHNGGPLKMLFAPIFGVNTLPVTARAVAIGKSGANLSVLETGNYPLTLNSNAGVNRDAGHNGSSTFILNSNSRVQGKIYLNTSTTFINNGGVATGGVEKDAGSNSILAQAVQAAAAAYSQFTALANNLGTQAIQLNSNQTLTKSGTATVNVWDVTSLLLNAGSSLTLNGTASMSFVIRVSGTFILNSNSNVYLSGGVTAGNVTFVATGTSGVILNSNSTLNGSILSPNGPVTLNSNATLYGTIVSGKSITINSNSVVTPDQTFLTSSGHGASLVN